jgi:hypothetical protein
LVAAPLANSSSRRGRPHRLEQDERRRRVVLSGKAGVIQHHDGSAPPFG